MKRFNHARPEEFEKFPGLSPRNLLIAGDRGNPKIYGLFGKIKLRANFRVQRYKKIKKGGSNG
ncbi:MAG: hypothetical protein V1653_00820 [bacterium]